MDRLDLHRFVGDARRDGARRPRRRTISPTPTRSASAPKCRRPRGRCGCTGDGLRDARARLREEVERRRHARRARSPRPAATSTSRSTATPCSPSRPRTAAKPIPAAATSRSPPPACSPPATAIPCSASGGPITIPPADSVTIAGDGAIWIVPPGGDARQAAAGRPAEARSPAGSHVAKGLDGLFRVRGRRRAARRSRSAGEVRQPRRLQRQHHPDADRHDRGQPRPGTCSSSSSAPPRDMDSVRRRPDAPARMIESRRRQMSNAALHVARTGLDAQNERMRVIANNLANVNTTGFKRDRAEFADARLSDDDRRRRALVRATIDMRPALNLGTGVRMTGTARINTQGALTRPAATRSTSRSRARAISRSSCPDGTTGYTRAGNFSLLGGRQDRHLGRHAGPARDPGPGRRHSRSRSAPTARSRRQLAGQTEADRARQDRDVALRQSGGPAGARRQSLRRDRRQRRAADRRRRRRRPRHDPPGHARRLERQRRRGARRHDRDPARL